MWSSLSLRQTAVLERIRAGFSTGEASQAVSDYGEYHFYKNFGNSFYDYSGNSYHAINGASPDADGSDTVITDRGLYFDGTSYVTIHNQVWGNPGPLESDWASLLWIYPTSRTVLLSRFREDTASPELAARFTLIAGDQMTGEGCISTSSPCTIGSATTTVGEMILSYVILMDYNINTGPVAFGASYVEVAGATYSTYLGTDFSSYYTGFIYAFRMKKGNTDRADFFYTTSPGLCQGYCYYNDGGTTDLALCSCDYCTSIPSRLCISTCTDHTLEASCSTANATCTGMLTYSGCEECANLPSCDLDGTGLNSMMCHSDCLTCNGPANTDCINCAITYQYVDSGTSLCECIDHSTSNGTECQCDSSYGLDTSGAIAACVACTSPCSECSGSATYCTDCVWTNANAVGGVCSCPVNSSLVGSACQCDTGFYNSCSGCVNQITCVSCDSSCESCTGPAANECASCSTGVLTSSNTCLDCPVGTYASPTGTCTACSVPCTSCSGVDNCSACSDNASLTGSMCECDAAYIESDSGCSLHWFYANLTVTPDNLGLIMFTEVLAEALTKSKVTITIENDPNFSWSITHDGDSVQLDFRFEEHVEDGALLTVNFIETILSESSLELFDTTLTGTLYEYVASDEALTKQTSLGAQGSVATILFTSILQGNIALLWTVISTLQVLMFIPLTNNRLNAQFRAFLLGLKGYNFVPNLFGYLLPSQGNRPYDLAYDYGYQTNDYLINAGSELTILLVCILGFITFRLLRTFLRSVFWIKQFDRGFRYSVFVRFWLTECLPLTVAALLFVLDVKHYSDQ